MRLIINADDFGMHEDVSDAIAEAMAKGFVTQTTLMVNMPDADRAVTMAREKGFANRVGLHLNLTEGIPLTEAIKKEPLFCNDRGEFNGFRCRSLRPFAKGTASAVREEIVAQIEKFLSYGLPMKHLDGHHHVHHHWPVLYVLRPLLKQYGFKTIRRTWWMKLRNDYRPHFRSRFNAVWFNVQMLPSRVKTADSFWNGAGVLKNMDKLVQEQICEVMLHPRYNSRGELVDTHDFEHNDGTPCCEIINALRQRTGCTVVTSAELV